MRRSSFVKNVDIAGLRSSPNSSITVDISEVNAAIKRLQDDQIPSFIRQYLMEVAREARFVMVQFSSPPYLGRRTNGLANSINIFNMPNGLMVGPSIYYAKWVYQGHNLVRGGVNYGWVLGRPAHEWTAETIKDRAPTIALSLAKRMFGGDE